MSDVASEITDNLKQIKQRIVAAQTRSRVAAKDITLVAVSKLQPDEVVKQGVAIGIRDLGENYVQELIRKQALFEGSEIRWHLIGPLQSNKAKLVVGTVALIHTLDRMSLAETLNRLALERHLNQEVLLQVNVAGEASKSGISNEEVLPFVRELQGLKGLSLKGFMTMPPFGEEAESSRSYFCQLRELRDQVNRDLLKETPAQFLSMGTSQDFEVAVEEGATHVRVGTILFGDRTGR